MEPNVNLPYPGGAQVEGPFPSQPRNGNSLALQTAAYALSLTFCCLLLFYWNNKRYKCTRGESGQDAIVGSVAIQGGATTRVPNDGIFCQIDTRSRKISLLIILGDGKRLVCVYQAEKTIEVWNVEDDKEGEPLKLNIGVPITIIAAPKAGDWFVTGDLDGTMVIWNTSLQKQCEGIQQHEKNVTALDVSSDGSLLASGSSDGKVIVWNTGELGSPPTPCWLLQHGWVSSVKFSPAGSRIASACADWGNTVKIWHSRTGDQLESIRFDGSPVHALAWSSDGRRLFFGGYQGMIGFFDTVSRRSSCKVVEPCAGDDYISSICVSSSDRFLVSFSAPGRTVYVWDIRDTPAKKPLHSYRKCIAASLSPDDLYLTTASSEDHRRICVRRLVDVLEAPYFFIHLAPFVNYSEPFTYLNPRAFEALKRGELSKAEDILSKEIGDKRNEDFQCYARANRAFVRMRRGNFSGAMDDAMEASANDGQAPPVTHIAKAMALVAQGRRTQAMEVFDSFQCGDAKSFVDCVKSVIFFEAENHVNQDHGTQFAGPYMMGDAISSPWVEAREVLLLAEYYIRRREYNKGLQCLMTAPDLRRHHYILEERVIRLLFGWGICDLHYMVQQLIFQTVFATDRTREITSFLQVSDDILDEENETRKLDLGWLSEVLGDEAMHLRKFGDAITWYSVSFRLFPELRAIHRESDFARRCLSTIETTFNTSAKLVEDFALLASYKPGSARLLAKRSWANAYDGTWQNSLADADQAIKMDEYCPWGYERRCVALHAENRYREATQTLCDLFAMFEKTTGVNDWLRTKYIPPAEVLKIIEKSIRASCEIQISPLVLIDVRTGKLCDAAERARLFKADDTFHELVSSVCMTPDTNYDRIEKVVARYFRYVMFSHTWEGEDEPTFQDISKNSVYQDDPHPLKRKLLRFCETVRADPKGYLWAWSDTCCIDKTTQTVYEESIHFMYHWYKESALTIALLARGSSTLKDNRWMTRAWTLQELLSPKSIRFYNREWELYQGDSSPNHKQSPNIIRELAEATDIAQETLVDFTPKSLSIRAKLRLASTREATKPVDIAYALIGIFDSDLEAKYRLPEEALGLLLQEIVHRERDPKAVLDWVGRSSQFNSCLPAHISVYKDPPHSPPPIPEDVMEARVVQLRAALPEQDIVTFFGNLTALGPIAFTYRRLSLPCAIFPISVDPVGYDDASSVRVYRAHAAALGRFEFKTLCTAFTAQDEVVLVHPWMRDFRVEARDPVSRNYDRCLRAVVHLEQPFRALLLVKQPLSDTYKRVAADSDILIPHRHVVSLEDITMKVLEIR